MTGNNHMKVGLSLSVLSLNPLFIIGCLIGSLTPDIDQERSILGKYFIINRTSIFKRICPHRTITHSLLAIFILVCLVHSTFGKGFLLGYISHLLLDMLTVKGIQFFYPLKNILEYVKLQLAAKPKI